MRVRASYAASSWDVASSHAMHHEHKLRIDLDIDTINTHIVNTSLRAYVCVFVLSLGPLRASTRDFVSLYRTLFLCRSSVSRAGNKGAVSV